MLRSLSRCAAAAFFACSLPLAALAPAAASEAAPSPEAAVVRVLRTYNHALPLAKARAYARSVMADAWRTHLDPKFILSIVTVESNWRANAVSRVGARGLGQLMPGTAHNLHVNPRNPADNLRGTSSYLKMLLQRFAGKPDALRLAIAGYNAGPKAVERFGGVPPYAETQRYVVKVLRVWKQLDARVGEAFSAVPARRAELAAARPPDEAAWMSSVDSAVGASALPVGTSTPAVTIAVPAATANAAAAPATEQ